MCQAYYSCLAANAPLKSALVKSGMQMGGAIAQRYAILSSGCVKSGEVLRSGFCRGLISRRLPSHDSIHTGELRVRAGKRADLRSRV